MKLINIQYSKSMDRETCTVWIKRWISYQSLRETLHVAPIAGVKTGSPSQQKMKRAAILNLEITNYTQE